MNAFDMSPRDFQLYLDERGYTGDQRDGLLRRYRRANSPFAGIFDFIEGLRGGDEEAGLRRGEIAPMVFPEGMSGFEAFTTGQARPAVPGFLLGGAEAAASAVDAPSAAAAGLIPAQDAAMEALGTAGFAMGAGGAAVRPAGSVGMGGRVADALPAPRNEAEAMAKQVLEMRAAGRAGDVTEEMMAAADPQYMFAHTPLPMDEASRMARREAMYGKDRYHGSNMDFQGFFGNVFTSDNPTVASTYNRGLLDAQIYPVVTRGGPLGEVTVEGGLSNWNQLRPDMIDDQSIARALDLGMPISTRDIERQAVLEGRSGVTFKDINDLGPGFNSQQFKNLGFAPEEAEALRLKYLEELAPSEVDVRLSPNLVRSRFARFDPEFAHLRNLSAANADKSTGLLAAAAAETPTGIRAYHGSPHDFDRFSMDAIGTGEGAQAYGHGLYFAEAEDVARGYRDALQFPRMQSPANVVEQVADDLNYHRGNVDAVKSSYQSMIDSGNSDAIKMGREKLDALPKAQERFQGRMYEVNIDANPEAFLDWDKPLSEQPEVARRLGYSDAAVIAAEKAKLYKSFEPPKGDTFKDLFAPLSAQEKAAAEKLAFMPEPWNEMTGKDAWLRAAQRRFSVMQDNGKWGPGAKTYEEALQMAGGDINKVRTLSDPSPQSRAEFMREAGVPGIKYFDAMSRGAGEGSRNYVVFNENLINIVRKYGIAGAAAVLGVSVADVEAAMAQGQQPPRLQGLLGVQ